jgi:hypothetical protein
MRRAGSPDDRRGCLARLPDLRTEEAVMHTDNRRVAIAPAGRAAARNARRCSCNLRRGCSAKATVRRLGWVARPGLHSDLLWQRGVGRRLRDALANRARYPRHAASRMPARAAAGAYAQHPPSSPDGGGWPCGAS